MNKPEFIELFKFVCTANPSLDAILLNDNIRIDIPDNVVPTFMKDKWRAMKTILAHSTRFDIPSYVYKLQIQNDEFYIKFETDISSYETSTILDVYEVAVAQKTINTFSKV